jgi:hypothetical protein
LLYALLDWADKAENDPLNKVTAELYVRKNPGDNKGDLREPAEIDDLAHSRNWEGDILARE